MILECPHPQIDQDWSSGNHQWREITPLAYCELKQFPLQHETEDAFMQSEPVDMLADGDGLYLCCQKADGYCFARLLPGTDWWELERLGLPDIKALSA